MIFDFFDWFIVVFVDYKIFTIKLTDFLLFTQLHTRTLLQWFQRFQFIHCRCRKDLKHKNCIERVLNLNSTTENHQKKKSVHTKMVFLCIFNLFGFIRNQNDKFPYFFNFFIYSWIEFFSLIRNRFIHATHHPASIHTIGRNCRITDRAKYRVEENFLFPCSNTKMFWWPLCAIARYDMISKT